MKHKKKIFIIIILFAVLVGFRYYLDKPYLKIINPKVESIFDEPVNMAAFLLEKAENPGCHIMAENSYISYRIISCLPGAF